MRARLTLPRVAALLLLALLLVARLESGAGSAETWNPSAMLNKAGELAKKGKQGVVDLAKAGKELLSKKKEKDDDDDDEKEPPEPFVPWRPTGNKPRCLFLTGIGVNRDGLRTGLCVAYKRYWGNVADTVRAETSCEPVFLVTDTMKRGWDDPSIVNEYCNAISDVGASIVVTHSMAGIVVANGIHNGVAGCARVAERGGPYLQDSVVWLDTQTPFRGSVGCDLCVDVCSQKISLEDAVKKANSVAGALNLFGKVGEKAINNLMRVFCNCRPGKDEVRANIRSMSTKYVSQKSKGLQLSCPPGQFRVLKSMPSAAARKAEQRSAVAAAEAGGSCKTVSSVAYKYVHGLLCGTSPLSLKVLTPSHFFAITSAVTHSMTAGWGVDGSTSSKAPFRGNDGAVGFESCRADFTRDEFQSKNPGHYLYAFRGHHKDGAFRSGDASVDPEKDQQPVRWLIAQIKKGLNALKSANA
jgi:ferredoxin